MTTRDPALALAGDRVHPYDRWIESQGIPVYREYHVDDIRALPLSAWDLRECDAAFLQLAGQEGVSAAVAIEIPPRATLPSFHMAIDEVAYVAQGRGLTNIWAEGHPKLSFEWSKHSMFLLPANYTYQLSNTHGSEPVRIMLTNGLPTAMAAIPNPDFYFKSTVVDTSILYGLEGGAYSEAKVIRDENRGPGRNLWVGNFFPNMLVWDQLEPFRQRGSGGRVVWFTFPSAVHGSHMSVFPARTYKKAHKHGPGVVIIIPTGEGYSVMWPPGADEKVVTYWQEGSVFVPPSGWWHQHFNAGAEDARYVAIHAPSGMPTGASVFTNMQGQEITQLDRQQIEYPDEDPWIRSKFEEELAKRGVTSAMPPEAYVDPNYQWKYAEDEA